MGEGADAHPAFEDLQRVLAGASLPAGFTREARVRLIGEASQALLAGQLPSAIASRLLASGILAWLEGGGDLLRDHWRLVKPKSRRTASAIWREYRHQDEAAHGDERLQEDGNRITRSSSSLGRDLVTIHTRNTDPDDQFEGQSFTRVLIARALGLAHNESPIAIAQKRWGQTNPMLLNVIKAAVAGGGTGSGEWGAELAQNDTRYTGDFVEYLYARTVFDQLGLRAVPSRINVKGQDGAFTGYWVGDNKAIPPSAGDYSDVNLTPLKVAGLAIISMELLEDGTPESEALVRDGLVEASSQRVDATFLSASAASAGVSPAGILNGVSALTPSGTSLAAVRDDLTSLLYPFVSNKMASGIVLVMNPATALALSMMYGALDQLAFPNLNETGGTLSNRRVIVGDNVTPGTVIAIRPQDVWRIGDSGIRVSMSRDATIEQQDNPTGATDTPVGMTTTYATNMFQEESVAFKVIRRINFQKRRAAAVQYLSDVEWGAVVS